MASPLNALQMKASNSCKIQVVVSLPKLMPQFYPILMSTALPKIIAPHPLKPVDKPFH